MSENIHEPSKVDNFFTNFWYKKWAPSDLWERYPTIESAITELLRAPTLEAAFPAF